MKFNRTLVVLVCLSATLAIGEELESVSYQSIPQLVADNEIKKVEIYDFGGNDIDAVFTKDDGEAVAVKRPLGLDQDAVLQQYLRDNNIPFVIYDYEFEGSSKRRSFGGSSSLFMILPMVFMFGVPILLIFVIIRQSRTISKQAGTIRALVEKEDSQP